MIYRDTYSKALEENNINPIDYPSIDIVQIGEGKRVHIYCRNNSYARS